jgi:hypothetical protein
MHHTSEDEKYIRLCLEILKRRDQSETCVCVRGGFKHDVDCIEVYQDRISGTVGM